jgi:hypothetical protein
MSFETCKATCRPPTREEIRASAALESMVYLESGPTDVVFDTNAMRKAVAKHAEASVKEKLFPPDWWLGSFPPQPMPDMLTVTVTGSGSSAPKRKSRGEEIAGDLIWISRDGTRFQGEEGYIEVVSTYDGASVQETRSDLVKAVAAAINQAIAEERRACAGLADEFINFTGATYCDLQNRKSTDPAAHDYGRGGCDARRGIAAAIRARGSK